MIGNLQRAEFAEILHTYLSPTSPIQSQEHLYGRQRQVRQIEQALCAAGRSIFIYGDRGVGKTSLAQTVAYAHQAAKHDPVLLACTPQTTFGSFIAAVLADLREPTRAGGSLTIHAAKVGFKGLGVELGRTRHEDAASEDTAPDLNGAVAALLRVGASRNEDTVVVIDEFDRISRDSERTQFADFIKQIGDRRIPIRFVFCGVSESMQKLLGAHGSCYRYLEGVELRGLSYDARFEIIDSAANALGVTVEDRPRFRIAAISDGFPHYVHLMCEKLFWQMLNDPMVCTKPTIDHYREAVAESVMGIEQHLKTTYEQAVMKDAPDYEQVLWAVADHADFIRNTESIYESYVNLFGPDQLDRQTVVSRLNTLKGNSCGHILTSMKKGWYQFRENIMRGYVRLRAEEKGFELALDYSAASTSSTSLAWPIRSARRGRMGTTPRDWERIKNPS